MMTYAVGGLVRSRAGHDKDQYFIILTESGEYVTLVDGLLRKVAQPKRKNKKHIQLIHRIDKEISRKLKTGAPVTDEEIRYAIRRAVSPPHVSPDESNKRNHRGM